MTFKTTVIDRADGYGPSSLAAPPVELRTPPPIVARRTVLAHAAPCWHCSRRLQACSAEGAPSSSRSTLSPHYKGAVLAWLAEIDGHERRLHAACAEALGFKAERARKENR